MSINWNKRQPDKVDEPIDLNSPEAARFFVKQLSLLDTHKLVSKVTKKTCTCVYATDSHAYFISAEESMYIGRALVMFGIQCGSCLDLIEERVYSLNIPATTVVAKRVGQVVAEAPT